MSANKWIGLTVCLCLPYVAAQEEPEVYRSVLLVAEANGNLSATSGDDKQAPVRYWADPKRGTIRRDDPSSGSARDLVTGIGSSYGLAFDQRAQSFLWTHSEQGLVYKLHNGSDKPVSLVTAFEEPFAIDVSTEDTKIAYVVDGTEVVKLVQGTNSDIEQRDVLAQLPDASIVVGMAFDPETQVLYLGDENGMMAYSISLEKPTLNTLAYDTSTFEPR